MASTKRVGVSPHLYCRPLVRGLEHDAVLKFDVDATTRNAIRLRERELDAAFLSPIDYARESSNYQIVPDVAVASGTADGSITLHFREGLHNITTLGIDPSSTSEIILARIILAEQYNLRPQLIPVSGSLDKNLRRVDAVLLVGDTSLLQSSAHKNRIDLVEEWLDLTELPYVHGFWCGWEGSLARSDVAKLQLAAEQGKRDLHTVAADWVKNNAGMESAAVKAFLEGMTFEFSEDVKNGLQEFIRYAYYHGVLPDVAETSFYFSGKENQEMSDDVSLN